MCYNQSIPKHLGVVATTETTTMDDNALYQDTAESYNEGHDGYYDHLGRETLWEEDLEDAQPVSVAKLVDASLKQVTTTMQAIDRDAERFYYLHRIKGEVETALDNLKTEFKTNGLEEPMCADGMAIVRVSSAMQTTINRAKADKEVLKRLGKDFYDQYKTTKQVDRVALAKLDTTEEGGTTNGHS
jgi:hypothetical protein